MFPKSSLPKCIYSYNDVLIMYAHIQSSQTMWPAMLTFKTETFQPIPSISPLPPSLLLSNPSLTSPVKYATDFYYTKTLNNHLKTRFYDSTSENILKVQYWYLLMTKDWMVLREKHLVVLLDWWSWMCVCVDASMLHTSNLFWMFWQGSLSKGWKSLMDEVTLHL